MKIFSWILFLLLVFVFGGAYFLASFSLFDEPKKVKLFDLSYQNQNYSVVSFFGSAVTSGSVQLFEINKNGNEAHKGFLSTNLYYEKGQFNKINDSIFRCVFSDGRNRKDTVLLNMKTKKVSYYSDSLYAAWLSSETNPSKK